MHRNISLAFRRFALLSTACLVGPAQAGECGDPCTVSSASIPNLQLIDTSTSGEDWELRTASDGDELQFINTTRSDFPLRIETGAGGSNNLLYLDALERIGINTSTPVEELQINAAGTPAIRLDDTSAGAGLADIRVATHTFGIAGNNGFNIFAIDTRAAATALFVNQSGQLGLATLNPQAQLHIDGDARVEGDIAIASSRTLKTAFAPVNSSEILAAVASLPVASWRYQTEGETERHIGPFAEDFRRLFGLGDGETISVIDAQRAQGVALAAIQGLQRELLERDATVAALRQADAELRAELEALKTMLASR